MENQVNHKELVALMGKIVTVHSTLHRVDDGDNRKWISQECQPRAGWFVGISHKQNGQYVSGSGMPSPYDYDYDPPHFEQRERVPCILVTFWPTMRPVHVPLDGFEIGGEPQSPCPKWTDADKKFMREMMSKVKRDKKGRWLE